MSKRQYVNSGSVSTESVGITAEDSIYVASQWQLVWFKFRKHKLAIIGVTILAMFVFAAIFSGFLSPYAVSQRKASYRYCPPMRVHFYDKNYGFSIRPFVYGLSKERDPITRRELYTENKEERYPIYFFVRGDEYKFLGLFATNLHLFGVERPGVIFRLGTDGLGRDLLSRLLYATPVSLSVGLVGVFLSFVLGSVLGGVSGYYGGVVDNIIQRIVELLLSIPTIPLWMGLAAAVPIDWSPIKTYFSITVILSLVNWCYLGRVVRGKMLEVREKDYVLAAKLYGTSEAGIIGKHMLPSFTSYLIVNLTLAIPQMILGETSLSFLGIGLQAPVVSWGVLLKDAQNIQTVTLNPWLLIPVIPVVTIVLALNFMGDGLRDAADPYK